MKKGDKVLVNIEAIEAAKAKMNKLHLGMGFNSNHPFLTSSLHDDIISRVKSGQNPTITKVKDGYANLIFDDGFECGTELDNISKI